MQISTSGQVGDNVSGRCGLEIVIEFFQRFQGVESCGFDADQGAGGIPAGDFLT
jgi:hypothetical protein